MLFNDVFSDDAFGFVNLTAAVQRLPYLENRLTQLGLFDGFQEGVETDMVAIDETEGQIQILQSRERGAPPQKSLKDKKAKVRAIKIPHFQWEDRVVAASLMGKRNPGENQMQSVVRKVNDRFAWMKSNMLAPTIEVHKLNALRGILLDADGDVIHNYFDFFEVTQIVHDFALANTATKVRARCIALKRAMEDELKGVPFTGIRVLCGRNFFDAFVEHPAVRDTFIYQSGQTLRDDLRKGFVFGDITWEEYRGMTGLTSNMGIVNADEGIAFPEGVPNMLRTYFAPAGFLETVNTLGQPLYAKVAPDFKYNEHVDNLMETNPLYINTLPRAVIRVTKS